MRSMKNIEITLDINTKTKQPYSGGNASLLQSTRTKNGYNSNEWGTFLCWKQLGRTVNKGEKGTECTRVVSITTNSLDKDGNPKIKSIPKFFKVFNEDQTTVTPDYHRLQNCA